MFCSNCGEPVMAGDRYCRKCGEPIPEPEQEPDTRRFQTQVIRPRLDVFFLSLLGSLGLSLVLMMVFHLPIFILGAFLPFFWRLKRSG